MHSVVVAVLIGSSVLGPNALSQRGQAPCPLDRQRLVAPVRGQVRQPFSMNRCRGCTTSRGLTIEVAPGMKIRATADGEVVFSGDVADRWWVVQDLMVATDSGNDLAGGGDARKISVTYGGFAEPPRSMVAGAVLRRGEVIGVAGDRVYIGIRVDGRYVDPFPCWGGRRARLQPADHVGRAGPPR